MAEPIPRWTTELREHTSGIDHLGLGSVSNQQILARLVPDLFVLTVHPGYHAFYSFVLDEYWRRDLPRSRAAWLRFFRSKELIYSIACNLCDHPDYEGDFGNIVGSRKTLALAEEPPRGGYATDTNYIKSPFGGYGLYYRSVMSSMGLVYLQQETKYPVDVPTELGKELAEGFRTRIGHTRYWNRYFDKDTVPATVVREYGEAACLCRLRDGNPDLVLTRDVLLHGGQPTGAAARRASLRMMLDVARATDGYSLDQVAFRQLVYYGEDEQGASWRPSADLQDPPAQLSIVDTWRRWRLYQAREFYAYALDGIWRWLVDWGLDQEGDARPIPIAEAIDALVEAVDPGAFAVETELPRLPIDPKTRLTRATRDLRRLAGEPDIFPAEEPSWPDRAFSLDADLTEWALYDCTGRGNVSPEVMATACLGLLLLTGTRFDHLAHEMREDWAYARAGGTQRLSLGRFILNLRRRMANDEAVRDLAEWILRDYVIAQHLRVANGKLPFNTYRFVQEGDALRFFDRTRPIDMNSARFTALSFTVSDLGFVEPLSFDEHALTTDGEAFLESGDWTEDS